VGNRQSRYLKTRNVEERLILKEHEHKGNYDNLNENSLSCTTFEQQLSEKIYIFPVSGSKV
jgi:hypothetical protein